MENIKKFKKIVLEIYDLIPNKYLEEYENKSLELIKMYENKSLDEFKEIFENSTKAKQKELSKKIFEISEYITDLEWDK